MKHVCKTISLLLIIFLIASSMWLAVFADSDDTTTNRFNIVFVNDESGSMTFSDEQKFRYEAIRRFVALMAQEGNRVGSVSFNEAIVDTVEMTDIEGFDDKNNFVDHISQFSPEGNYGMTNIGLAIKTAVELLDSGRNTELPSIIILLTDGDTQMPTDKEKEVSLEQKADAIEAARQAGYSIYSICLGGGAHEKELEQISAATGGEFEVVRDAADLEDVQMMFYKIIFKAMTDDATLTTIGSDGKAVQSFDVPGIGVEELNIIIEGEMTDCTLADPNGRVYSGAELDKITMLGKDFRLIKVTDPIGGKWTATVYGDAGVSIKFKPLYNSSFYLSTSMTEQSEYKIGDVVNFDAVICDKHGPVTDTNRYGGFECRLHVSYKGEEQIIAMDLGDDGFTTEFKIENDGTYYAYITVIKGDLVVEGEDKYEFSVNNCPPVATEEEFTAHANIWPFFGGKATIDLTETAVDPDGDALTFSIDSTAFNTEDYKCEDNVLTVDNFSIKKGSFTIRATDARGAYCMYDVLVTSTNIGMLMFIGLCVGAVIVLAAVIYGAWRLSRNPFNGDVKLTERKGVSDGAADTKLEYELPRGSIAVEYWNLDTSTYLPSRSRIQAGARKDKCIYLVTKKPVYDELGKKAKKHKIKSCEPVIFSMDQDASHGIKIEFTHNDDKNGGWF